MDLGEYVQRENTHIERVDNELINCVNSSKVRELGKLIS